MNLDKLKELEAKVWTEGLDMFGETHEELWARYNGNTLCKPLSSDQAVDAVELLNQTKEMIETIERYKAALEGISTCKRCELCARSATDALKEADKVRDEP